jgi:hypothetical protein
VVKSKRKRDRDINSPRVSLSPQQQEAFGGVVNNEQELVVEQQGFTTEDILWALGIWSVILCLSPVIVFYMLMVA